MGGELRSLLMAMASNVENLIAKERRTKVGWHA
jgi:hypothetical protein